MLEWDRPARRGRSSPSRGGDDPEPVTFRYELDEEESPSYALVEVISSIARTSRTGFEPLGAHVDLEAIDDLIASTEDGGAISASLTLSVDGFTLAVDGSEIVGTIEPDAADGSPNGG